MLSHQLRRYRAAAAQATDVDFKQVSLLLHGDGTNGAQNNTFLDSSANNFTLTRNGSATQGTNTPFSQAAGYWSNYFNGSTDFLSIPSNAALQLGTTAQFTVEAFVCLQAYPSSGQNSVAAIFSTATTGNDNFYFAISGSSSANTNVQFNGKTGGSFVFQVSANYAFQLGTWYHIAIVRTSSSTAAIYVNGVSQTLTTSVVANWTDSSPTPTIGKNTNANTSFNFWFPGYISNFRIVKGTAVYTGNFTSATTPLTAITNTSLLTCQSNYFKDNSSNNFTITATGTPSTQPFSPFAPTSAYSTSTNGGSMYFNGTTDYLTFSGTTFSGAFTVEAWVYIPSFSAAITGFGNYTAGVRNNQMVSFTTGAKNFVYLSNNVNIGTITGTITIPVNTWTHIAVTRDSSNNLRLFTNGVLDGTPVTYSGSVFSSFIGCANATSSLFNGYISNLRTITGTALYTATFTPPTAPLTAVTNTSLLLNGTNAGIYDNAAKNDLVTVGNAQISTSIVKYGTGSIAFDGTGDWLSIPNSSQFNLGTGDFTIECWFYIAGNSALNGANLRVATLFSALSQSGTLNGYDLSINGNSTTTGTGLFFENYVSGTLYQVSATTTIAQSTWHHIAVVRSGTTTTIYLNGTSVASGTLGNQNISNFSNATQVGRLGYTGYVSEFNGYIDDLRITKGVARYTANFTPPTAAFPDNS